MGNVFQPSRPAFVQSSSFLSVRYGVGAGNVNIVTGAANTKGIFVESGNLTAYVDATDVQNTWINITPAFIQAGQAFGYNSGTATFNANSAALTKTAGTLQTLAQGTGADGFSLVVSYAIF